ncbi:MAG: SHD1 domain-containing protein [Verrucomicrobia bacterium]|nr:SHD1 domain-containing protein [Verrucomicrobiota bacterium]
MEARPVTIAKGLTTLLTASLLAGSSVADERVWTDTQGRKLTAQLLGIESQKARLRLASGKESQVDLEKLSPEDLHYIQQWKAQRPERITWPEEIDVREKVTVTPVREDADAREFVYRTEHFEFHSDEKIAGSLIKDFSLAFEATLAAIAALPLNLKPEPPQGHFQIGDRFDYYAAGGLIGTAGVYVPLERHILVPMDGLNLKRVGSELRKNNSDYDNSTLIHEITHQVMHDWLKHMPTWMLEGLSEFMSSLPYANGKFRFGESARKNGIRAALTRWEGGRQTSYSILPAETLFSVNSRQWNQTSGNAATMNYSSSMLYVYYFMHLAGRGEGEDIRAFAGAIDQAKPSVAPYLKEFDTALRAYVAKSDAAEKSGGTQIMTEDDIPEILLVPPDAIIFKKGTPHESALARMIGQRDLKQLTEDVIAAFSKDGIRLE